MSSVPGLTAQAQRVLGRWNPDGIDRWRDRGGGESGAVHVVTVRGIDPSAVRAAVAAQVPVTDEPDDAAVVVFVLDALSVLGRDELSALDAAAARVECVLFTTSADAPDVVERDEALLRAHSPRYADVRILGPAELVGAMRDTLGEPANVVAARNRRRAAVSLVEETSRMIAETAESIRADDAAALRERRTRLIADRSGGRAQLSALVRSDVQRARIDLVHVVGLRTRELSTLVRAEIDRAGRHEMAVFPDRFAQLAAALTVEVDTAARHRLEDLVGRAGLTDPPSDPVPAEASVPPPAPRHRGVEDRMMVIVGASAGVGLGRLAVAPLSMVPALDIATIPVTLTLGGAAAWWLARSRRLVADRAHLRQWASDATAGLRAQLEQRVLARLLETEAAVGTRVIADGHAATAAVDDEIAAIDSEVRRLAAQRSGRLASCDRDRSVLAEELVALDVQGPAGTTMEPIGEMSRPTQ